MEKNIKNNNDLLKDIIITLDILKDRIDNLDLNIQYIYKVIKEKENNIEKSDNINKGWFIF
jgi:hypothetical protein